MKVITSFISICSSLLLAACSQTEIENKTTGNLSGIVSDMTTGEPVSVVNLSLEPGGNSTVTGSDGSFSFKNLTAGTYTIHYTKDGYKEGSKDIFIERGRESQANLLIERIPAVIAADCDLLDFGETPSINTLSFNIVNSSYETLSWKAEYNCPWIVEISPSEGQLAFGKTATIVVTIDRSLLTDGENETVIVIRSSNGAGNAEVKIKAVRNDPERLPDIEIAGLYGKIDYMEGTGVLSFNIKDFGKPLYSDLILTIISYRKDGSTYNNESTSLVGVTEPGQYFIDLINMQHWCRYTIQLIAINSVGTVYSNILEIPIQEYIEIKSLGIAVQTADIGSGDFYTVNSLCNSSFASKKV